MLYEDACTASTMVSEKYSDSMRPKILAAQGQERVNLAIFAAGAAAYEGNKMMLFFLMFDLGVQFQPSTIDRLIDVAMEEGHHALAQWIANPLAEA